MMDDFIPSDWIIEKASEKKTVSFRLRIGINSIGSHSSSDIRIDSPLVSRHHAEIKIPEHRSIPCTLRDLNSINGTYINRTQYQAQTKFLYDGDVIGFGLEFDKDEDDVSELPIYVFKLQPLKLPPPPMEFENLISSDDNNNDADGEVMKPIILSVFGNVDEKFLTGLEVINRSVCEAVNVTLDPEIIELSSDEEENSQNEKVKSNICLHLMETNDSGASILQCDTNEPEIPEDANYESEEIDLDEKEVIYSEELINEIKSEMVDDEFESGTINVNEWRSAPKPISPENIPIISLIDDDDDDDDDVIIVESNGDGDGDGDDDDFNKDLEFKVSKWTNLLIGSQIYPNMNRSQRLISDTIIDSRGQSSDDELLVPMDRNDIYIVSQNFEPLEENLHNRSENVSPKEEANLILHSPVVKRKRRRKALVLESEESDSNNEDPLELNSQLSTEEMITETVDSAEKGTERRYNTKTGESARSTHRDRTAIIISPHHLKYGRRRTNSKNSKIWNARPVPNPFLRSTEPEIMNCMNEVKKVIRKNAELTRIRNAPNKLRFADFQKSFEEKQNISRRAELLQAKLKTSKNTKEKEKAKTAAATCSKAQSPIQSPSTPTVDIFVPEDAGDIARVVEILSKGKQKKKSVRFNDEVITHYFESNCESTRKVDGKDIMPHLSYRHRRDLIRRTFPVTNQMNQIISLILAHSNEWLAKKFPGASGTSSPFPSSPDNIGPIRIPTEFKSFAHYKRILLPLMKLEYLSNLEREMEANKNAKIFHFVLEQIMENNERITLVMGSENRAGQELQYKKKIDLFLMTVGELQKKTFAYMAKVNPRKLGTVSACERDRYNLSFKIYLEIMPNSIDLDYLRKSKIITIQTAIDNLQVTIGAYNAVYQLEATPLNEILLNPTSLVNSVNALPPPLPPPAEPDEDIAPMIRQNDLNVEQMNAVKEIYKKICFSKVDMTPNLSLVQGPPGTGKSFVVVNLALQLVYGLGSRFRDMKILICAQSNCAIDSVAAKLLEARSKIKNRQNRFTLVRFGIFEKMNTNVHPISLHNLLEFERVKKLTRNINTPNPNVSVSTWKDKLQKFENERDALEQLAKTNPDMEIQQKLFQKNLEIDCLRTAFKNALTAEEQFNICKGYLEQSNIVCTTLSSCVKLFQWIDYFDICIIDEATQCTEPWTLLPLKFGISSLILVGDSQQLPTTVLSKEAADYGLTRSLFTRIENSLNKTDENRKNSSIFRLRVQYRMHPEICTFPNSFFYNNSLINANNTLRNTTALMPYSIFNLNYDYDSRSAQGKIINQLEADFVVELLKALNEYIPIQTNTYGVITPYAKQCKILADAIRNARMPQSRVTVNTIDSYQGIEKDVILISNALRSGVGLLANAQRLNVAITRPKKCLILCGNFRNVESFPVWCRLLQNARQRNAYYEIGPLGRTDSKAKVIQRILARN